ncbi:MAG: 4-oxalocrotonate tautomerase family protein [Candidatus Zixiibacteriota bacterium]
MPFIEVKLIEGVFSDTQKREIIEKLTDAMVSIEGENMREVTTVVIEEMKSGSWGIGGKALTAKDAKLSQPVPTLNCYFQI